MASRSSLKRVRLKMFFEETFKFRENLNSSYIKVKRASNKEYIMLNIKMINIKSAHSLYLLTLLVAFFTFANLISSNVSLAQAPSSRSLKLVNSMSSQQSMSASSPGE